MPGWTQATQRRPCPRTRCAAREPPQQNCNAVRERRTAACNAQWLGAQEVACKFGERCKDARTLQGGWGLRHATLDCQLLDRWNAERYGFPVWIQGTTPW